jgi:hypothetical protein
MHALFCADRLIVSNVKSKATVFLSRSCKILEFWMNFQVSIIGQVI